MGQFHVCSLVYHGAYTGCASHENQLQIVIGQNFMITKGLHVDKCLDLDDMVFEGVMAHHAANVGVNGSWYEIWVKIP